MGKQNFSQIYSWIKEDFGDVTCKVSYYSDNFNWGCNYSCVLIYGVNGQTTWVNSGGKASGCKGRSLYCIIKDTAYFPDQRAVGEGRVHYYPIEEVIGTTKKENILCSGFAFHNNQLKYSSIWLNESQQLNLNGEYNCSDGSKYLSNKEKILVDFIWKRYKEMGPNAIIDIPWGVERRIIY